MKSDPKTVPSDMETVHDTASQHSTSADFIRQIVEEDLRTNVYQGRVHTRFPPEPNGYIHLGSAKAICISFGIAKDYRGLCNLRFDDTNPTKEDVEYVESIKEDIRWLGFDWEDRELYASDYFDQLYTCALKLIKKGSAYVCDLSAEEIRYGKYRGTLTEAGIDSPYRDRPIKENLELFERMRAGEFENGSRTLRAKIDMASPNLVMRDPVMYRILHETHHRTRDEWCIYPMYDFTHCISDSIEGITHSLCSLEFEINRPLYNWFLDQLDIYHPQQIEFAKLFLSYTVLGKRKLIQLVQEKHVNGWDDPRMPTLSGLRRAGYTPEAIRDFCNRIGISKADNLVDVSLLAYCLRQDLNKRALRVMAVLEPLKVIIDNYPENKTEELNAENNPEDEDMGSRKIPFSRELYIERDDFTEHPPKKYFRLAPGREVRLKHAYYITCNRVVKDKHTDEIIEVHCNYDHTTRGGWSDDGRKVRGTLHWVSAPHAVEAEVRLYEHLFTKENPNDIEEGREFTDYLNPNSLQVLTSCKVEPNLAHATLANHYQFLRKGYFCLDSDASNGKLVFNRTVTLRDTWAKIQNTQRGSS